MIPKYNRGPCIGAYPVLFLRKNMMQSQWVETIVRKPTTDRQKMWVRQRMADKKRYKENKWKPLLERKKNVWMKNVGSHQTEGSCREPPSVKRKTKG